VANEDLPWRKPLPAIAKVGVESSNLFARSNFLLKIAAIKAVLRGRFLLPAPQAAAGGQARNPAMRRIRTSHFRARALPEAPLAKAPPSGALAAR